MALLQTVDTSPVAFHRVEGFNDHLAAVVGRFVRSLRLWTPHYNPPNRVTVSRAYARLLACLPFLESLALRCHSAEAIDLLRLLPPSLTRTLRHLELTSRDSTGVFDSATAAAFIDTFPELISLDLVDIRQGQAEGAQLAVDALRHLDKLQVLVIVGSDGLNHPTLGLPWSSSLRELDLGAMTDFIFAPALLQAVLKNHASTLATLRAPFYPDHIAFPPITFPALHTLQLQLGTDSAALPHSFEASPLRTVVVEMYEQSEWFCDLVAAVHGMVQEHRGTLDIVSLVAYSTEGPDLRRADQDALDELERLCREEDIVYKFECETW